MTDIRSRAGAGVRQGAELVPVAMATPVHITTGPTAEDWAACVAAYLATCERRSGSARTPALYGQCIRDYARGMRGDLSATTPGTVQLYAYCPTAHGTPPAPSTVIVRLAALRGLYAYATRAGLWVGANPAADVERPRQADPVPKGLDADGLRRLLAAVPDTASGARDRAAIVTAALTGLRRAELLGLTRDAIDTDGGMVTYTARVKGGHVRRRELPGPAWRAILAYLERVGTPWDGLPADARLFPITPAGFAANLDRYARRAGLGHLSPHGLRHSAAKLRRAGGATLEDVQGLLGHRSLSTTARYLARLEAERDTGWMAAAAAIGLDTEPAAMPRARRRSA